METIRSLAEVRTRLENAVAALPGDPADSAELYERIEMISFQVLDCWECYTSSFGACQMYLELYLLLKRLELGLIPLDPRDD
jgi:hypothetical protein